MNSGKCIFEDEVEGEFLEFTVAAEFGGHRLDKLLAELCAGRSRSYLKTLIERGHVEIDGVLAGDPSAKIAAGRQITLVMPPPEDMSIEPEDIPLDIVYEDEHLLVINKPAGLVVHPGAGNWRGTLVNALLHHCRGQLSGIGGVARPGIVHRLDKDTSGLMVAAKTDRAHRALAAQLEDRSLGRTYLAVVLGVPSPPAGTVDMPIGRHRVNRQRMAVVPKGGRRAVTNYRVADRCGEYFSLVECRLETGRTHQIRVHMEAVRHPLIGDPVYSPQPTAVRAAIRKAGMPEDLAESLLSFPRQMLHAVRIDFIHPANGEEMFFEALMPEDLLSIAGKIFKNLIRYDES